jgi:hypothetical protein
MGFGEPGSSAVVPFSTESSGFGCRGALFIVKSAPSKESRP